MSWAWRLVVRAFGLAVLLIGTLAPIDVYIRWVLGIIGVILVMIS